MSGESGSNQDDLRTLIILRHAKSSWNKEGLSDFERPLVKRGQRAALRMGAFIAAHAPSPARVLCSTALRARQTLDLILPLLSEQPETEFIAELYLRDAETLLSHVRRIPTNVDCAMLVGHNPDLQELAIRLAGSGSREDTTALSWKFPTAAVAILAFNAKTWGELQFGAGHLSTFMTPKLLA